MFWQGTDSCPEVLCAERFASHTSEGTSELLGAEGPQVCCVPPELTRGRAAIMIALLRGVATTLLSSTLNIVAARTEVQESDPSLSCFTSALISSPDVFWKRGIELRRMCCSREGSDPRCVSARKQFWDVHRVQEPDSIVH